MASGPPDVEDVSPAEVESPRSISPLLSAGPLSTDMTDRMGAVWAAGVPVRIDWRAEGFESSSKRLVEVALYGITCRNHLSYWMQFTFLISLTQSMFTL